MILDSDQISRLHAGEHVDHQEPIRPHHGEHLADGATLWICPYQPTRTYAAQPAAGRKASCRIHVLSTGRIDDQWQLTLAIVREHQQAARLLRPSGGPPRGQTQDGEDPVAHGYTNRPSQAMTGEPEAIDHTTLDWYAEQNRRSHQARKLAEDAEMLRGQKRTIEERITLLEQVGRDRGVDIADDLKVARNAHDRAARRLDAIEAKINGQRAA